MTSLEAAINNVLREEREHLANTFRFSDGHIQVNTAESRPEGLLAKLIRRAALLSNRCGGPYWATSVE